jgi:hypothetical protein
VGAPTSISHKQLISVEFAEGTPLALPARMRLGGVALLLIGCSAPTVSEFQQGLGEQKDGFPNRWERALLMAANRARSDPSTVKGPASAMYPAHAPLTLDYDLARAARFHATTLETGMAPLMHNSPCVLKSDVGTSGCDGKPECACANGQTCNSCGTCAPGTDPFQRVAYFYRGQAAGEIAAAGYGDPFRTMDGWVDEPAGADGHRSIVNSGAGVVGFGHAEGTQGACWDAFDVGDFGADLPAIAKIASAASNPIGGAGGSYQIYATWSDPAGAPRSLSAVVDGKCLSMAKELGDEKLNATYRASTSFAVGCHSIYILGADSAGARALYPTTTAFTVVIGSGACAEEVAQPPADCDPTFLPPAPDLANAQQATPPPQSPDPQSTAPSTEIEGGCAAVPGADLDGAWILVLLATVRRLTRKR